MNRMERETLLRALDILGWLSLRDFAKTKEEKRILRRISNKIAEELK